MQKTFALLFIICFLVSACGPETKKQLRNVSAENKQGGFLKCTNITGNKKNKFFKYIDSKDIKNAEELYFKNENWFVSCEHKLENYIPKLASLINNKYNYKFENYKKYFEKEHNSFEWNKFKQNQIEAKKLLSSYKKERYLNQHYKFKINYLKEIEFNISKNEDEYKNNLYDNFNTFDIFKNKKSFFELYPYYSTSLEKKDLLDKRFQNIFIKFNDNQLINNNNFIRNYFPLLNQDNKLNIKKAYLDKFYFENKIDESNLSLTQFLKTNDKILNLVPKNMGVPKINKKLAFFEISKSKIELDYNYKIKNDSKIINEFKILNQDEFKTSINDYDYIFAFLIDDCVFESILEAKDIHQSEFVIGTQQINNPKYNQVVNALNMASNSEANAYYNQQYECNKTCPYGYEWTCLASCTTWTAAYLKWSGKKNALKRQLNSTPAYINENIYQPYEYYSTKVKAIKNTKFNLIVYDNIKNEIYIKKENIYENNFFNLVYNLNQKDEDKNKILKRYKEEKDINTWKNSNIEISLDRLINNFKKNRSDFELLDSNFNIASLKKNNENLNIQNIGNDQKSEDIDYFISVAKIIRGDGGFGTGFYITPNIIITNQHVIDNSNLINVELKEGSIGTANLIAQDFSKDLAALKSTVSGVPVKISKEPLSLGKDVIAVGHPEGLGFSITKGIISAIRKQQSINDFGLSEVQYIQTDAAINQGNSGGPLFLNGELVGVNTQGVRKDIAEGLNFAVHRNELIDFINKNLKNYLTINN